MQPSPECPARRAEPSGQIRELTTIAQVHAAAAHDPLVTWVAQGLRPGVRAWAAGDAVAVAGADIARRDRLAVRGGVRCVARLVRHALAELGPSYRPIGDADLIMALPGVLDGLQIAGEFGWMDTTEPVAGRRAARERGGDRRSPGSHTAAGPVASPAAHWLPDSASAEIDDLLDRTFTDSYARPRQPGVLRWAGARDADGVLVAVAAEAWSAPRCQPGPSGDGVGLIAGVATDQRARRGGYGRTVCSLLVDALVARYGRAGLMVDTWNVPAVTLYKRLGLRWRSVATARTAAVGHRHRPTSTFATTGIAAAGHEAAGHEFPAMGDEHSPSGEMNIRHHRAV